MRRAGNLIERIAEAENIRLAFWKAARGKQTKAEVIRFRENLDREVRELREQLRSGSLPWGPYHRFMIRDPKERLICEPPFHDQVAQHAILNIAEPVFEAYQIHDSYACRKGKGVDGALKRAVAFAARGGWFLKMDIRKYFDSIHHDTLKAHLRRRFKDRTVLTLFDGVIDSYRTTPGCGVPIGNLTSQFFANHYLAVLDHFIQQTCGCRGLVRYMDDSVVWDGYKERLREVHRRVDEFVRSRLHLELKPVCLNRCDRGLTFLGYRVFPHRLGLAKRSRFRFRDKLRRYDENYETGLWTEAETARHVESLLAFVRRAGSLEYRRRIMEQLAAGR
jgi:retron-type reverse transcriptase